MRERRSDAGETDLAEGISSMPEQRTRFVSDEPASDRLTIFQYS